MASLLGTILLDHLNHKILFQIWVLVRLLGDKVSVQHCAKIKTLFVESGLLRVVSSCVTAEVAD